MTTLLVNDDALSQYCNDVFFIEIHLCSSIYLLQLENASLRIPSRIARVSVSVEASTK
jgi:hypothetical protein